MPVIVGLGGTITSGSSTEKALAVALEAARRLGAEVLMFGGASLAALPHYGPGAVAVSEEGRQLVAAVREADGVVVASPGYHGSISGLVKNALDYLQETAGDERPYLDGLPVGLIVTAYGWQAIGSTLTTLRSVVHGLRGWPTPLGAGVRSTADLFRDDVCADADVERQLRTVGEQVMDFAMIRSDRNGSRRAGLPIPSDIRTRGA